MSQMKTVSISSQAIEREWHILDAKDIILGKLASTASSLLMGKHKTGFTRHMNDGDYVIVINARHIRVTGKKAEQKKYYHHTGYVGHLREKLYSDVLAKTPERIIERAVHGMLPKTKLGRAQYRNLYVYADQEHKHTAQSPKLRKIS